MTSPPGQLMVPASGSTARSPHLAAEAVRVPGSAHLWADHSSSVRDDRFVSERYLPSGTVTFLFTDVEGSTRLLREHGAAYAELLAEHRRVIRAAFARHGGVEVDTQGDAFFVAFPRATDAVAAADEAREALAGGQ